MQRLLIILVLFVSVFALMRGISETWREKKPFAPVAAKKSEKQEPPLPELLRVQPEGPLQIPDLKTGYLFNEQRLLETETVVPPPQPLPVELGNDLGINADIEQLTFSGSLISEKISRAIVKFPPAKEAAATGGKSRAAGRKGASASKKGVETALLEKGDILSGYTVEDIMADKIILKKGDEVIEKFLYDPSKKRSAPAPRVVKRDAPGTANPEPSTRGGRKEPAEDPFARASAARGAGRKMVVSRQPASRPDTSRVSRRRRRSSVSTPPMPPMPPMEPTER